MAHAIPGVDLGPGVEEQLDHLRATGHRGPVQRGVSVDVSRLEVGSSREQAARDRPVTALRCEVQRRVPTLVRNSSVPRVGGEQRIDHSEIPLARSPQDVLGAGDSRQSGTQDGEQEHDDRELGCGRAGVMSVHVDLRERRK
jgi:hypothetical protein